MRDTIDCGCGLYIAQLQAENHRLRSQLETMQRRLQHFSAADAPLYPQYSPMTNDDGFLAVTNSDQVTRATYAERDGQCIESSQPLAWRPIYQNHNHDSSYETSFHASELMPAANLQCSCVENSGSSLLPSGLSTAQITVDESSVELGQLQQDDDRTLAEYDQLLVVTGENNITFPTPCPPAVELLNQPSPSCTLTRGFYDPTSLGLLDRYIMALGSSLKSALDTFGISVAVCQKLAIQGVLWVVQEAWPQAENYWKVTASFQGFLDIEMWRNFPCAQTYQAMHPFYRPTQLQLCIPHHPLVDWLPWPELRDKLIQQQHEFPEIEMVCRAAIHNVVAHRRSLTHEQIPGSTSSRVWDLCTLEEQAGFSCLSHSSSTSTRGRLELVRKPQSAPVTALERAYQLEFDDFCTQKLHPAFFESLPSLYCASLVSPHSIRQLPGAVQNQPVLGRPRPLDPASVGRLRVKLEYELQSGHSWMRGASG